MRMEQPRLFEVAALPTPSTVQLVESLLFIAGESVTVAQLAQALELPADAVEAALEALAIIAYRQPITRAQVDAVRGVDSSGVIRALMGRDLIVESGRLETVGRPILYATTPEFLRQFGLANLAELPPLDLPDVDRTGERVSG